ncbi:hypothetical protein [Oceanithermus sp.]|jgi:hypothetical protein
MKISQSTRILILLALIVAAVAVWYSLFFAGSQPQPATATTVTIPHKAKKTEAAKPVAVTTSARALQVLPIPFLVTEAPEEVPLETAKTQTVAAVANVGVPPNPFVPLKVEVAAPPKKPEQVPESEKPVLVTPEAELTPNIPVPKTIAPEDSGVTPPPVSLGKGTLPIKLSPLAQEVSGVAPLAEAVAENQPQEEPAEQEPAEARQEPQAQEEQQTTEPATEPQEPPPPPPPNPLEVWAQQQRLRLDGVALGPVGVAIFETASGYLALPVGQTFPDKNVLVKTITAERVLLVDSSGTNTLTLELGGGE